MKTFQIAERKNFFKRIWSFAQNTPDQVIVIDKDQAWTWTTLLSRANCYADALKDYCEDPSQNPIMPLLAGRNVETVAAILGILISGRAVAPVSPEQPKDRLLQCVSFLESKIMVSSLNRDDSARFEQFPVHFLKIAERTPELRLSQPPLEPERNRLLYVLFTSGSTGQPKGVVANFENIINTMRWSSDILSWRRKDVMGCVTNFFFDISMFDVFTTFYFGTPLAILSNPSDALLSVDQIARFGVTSIFSTPAFFSNIIRSNLLSAVRFPSLRRIISGGDFFPPAHILSWRSELQGLELYNVWGPTETSIVNTMHLVNDSDTLDLKNGKYPPVGKAHPRMPFILLDEFGAVVQAPLTRGEICMLGSSVTQGYLNDKELTRKYFFEHQGQPAFRTQDLGYTDEKGNLYILGRTGSTVKVAGYRIDLSEVESAATRLEGVHLAGAFVVETEPGIKELWLGLEMSLKGEQPNIFLIKQSLRKLLPLYMVPKRILIYEELPKSANRKINRKALAEQGMLCLTTGSKTS